MVAVAALRSALAAIANAEAVPAGGGGRTPTTSPHVAGAAAGLGAGEAQRQRLTAAEIGQIVESEIGERQEAAADYERGGHAEQAARLRREAQALRDVLDRQSG
jgi:hypothetical protein